MARATDTYSRVVFWLKVLLPLIALGLLSTMFLLSRDPDAGLDLPIADVDLRDRAERQQVTEPNYSGTTASGMMVSLFATAARPVPDNPDQIEAEAVEARILTTNGERVTITAGDMRLTQDTKALRVAGGVKVNSSTGYDVSTEALAGTVSPIHAVSEGPVQGEGPPGRFTAGRMEVIEDAETGNLYLNFTGGVNLIYEPQPEPE